MIREIYICSPPRRVGGSGTEILHLIDLFRQKEIDVTVVMGPYGDQEAITYCQSIGVKFRHWPQDNNWDFIKDKVVLAHGNPNFQLHCMKLKSYGPAKIIYISPMWEISPTEMVFLNMGLIDHLVHVSNAQRAHHQKTYKLKGIMPPITTGYIPYINPDNRLQDLRFNYKAPTDYFGVGRVQRPDPQKFNADMWDQMRAIKTPVPKKIMINGWQDDMTKKVGVIPTDLDVKTYIPYEINIKPFYDSIHMLVQRQGGSGESWGRYVAEAFCCGVPAILENGDTAFNEMGEPGKHFGWSSTSDCQASLATALADDPVRMHEMAHAARRQVERTIGNVEYVWRFWEDLFK